MVYKDGHTSGSLLGEGWKQVEEWPDAARRARAAGEDVPGDVQAIGDGADDDGFTDEEEEVGEASTVLRAFSETRPTALCHP